MLHTKGRIYGMWDSDSRVHDDENKVLLEFHANWNHINEQVHRKNHEEERPKVVKHLREEVPPQSSVRRQVGKC